MMRSNHFFLTILIVVSTFTAFGIWVTEPSFFVVEAKNYDKVTNSEQSEHDEPSVDIGSLSTIESVAADEQLNKVLDLFSSLSQQQWKSIERIDNKIANTLVFATLFVAVIGALVAAFEYFKLKELESIRLSIKENVDAELSTELRKFKESYLLEIQDQIVGVQREIYAAIKSEAKKSINMIHAEEDIVANVYRSYLENEIDAEQPLTPEVFRKSIDLIQFINSLKNENDKIVHAGLKNLSRFIQKNPHLSKSTIDRILYCLETIDKDRYIKTPTNFKLFTALTDEIMRISNANKEELERPEYFDK